MPIPQGMTNLSNHLDFEAMLRPRTKNQEMVAKAYAPFVCVSFSANWCGPCRRIDKKMLVSRTPSVLWYHCDVDENDVTLGYCGGNSIPTFVLVRDGHFVGKLEGPRDAPHVLDWLTQYGVPTN